MGSFQFAFINPRKVTLEEANQINKDFVAENPEPQNEEDALTQKASSFLTNGEFQKSLEIYQQLVEDYPEQKGLYLSQVGANLYFLEEYEKAIDLYVQAREHGMDSDMMDDNIWEACEAIFKQTQDKSALEKYLELCPEGNYLKEVNQLLSK